ncbi:DNA cytosine methyltransferase [Sphingobium algorifonticola]|uniref:DNA (cytosine-5-)-methyltransferase n=1 Tax=Sphingobium algorifonticola TaxID=2008318 RepID=A0A437J9B0_9SPHN|nr:DNA cytosine methyltransferase [Sphingobium algorifonticola]RVT42078.1 DNA cytosine methyltransferase [Sphingobium algorifonticola]
MEQKKNKMSVADLDQLTRMFYFPFHSQMRSSQRSVMHRFISIFSGAGGLDLGLEQSGWECSFATDHDVDAVATLERNRGYALGQGRKALGGTIIKQADVRNLQGAEILSELGLLKGDVPLLAGGPPCQSWSSGGLQKGFSDPRGRLVDDYLRLAQEIDARWLLFENVRGLLTARGQDGVPGSALAYVRARLYECGWHSKAALLNAADFGVPQRRVRLILIGYRAGDEPEFPGLTHSLTPNGVERPWVTLGECLAKLPPPSGDEIIRPTGKMALELADLPPGSGAKSEGKKEATRPGGHWGYKQGAFIADVRKAARTVTASSQQDWIRDPVLGLRRLTPRECAAIQTFPPEWVMVGNRQTQYRLIGNAVPPAMGRALGVALIQRYNQHPECMPVADNTVLAPLPAKLQSAIAYTIKEERRNGPSRRAASKRNIEIAAVC